MFSSDSIFLSHIFNPENAWAGRDDCTSVYQKAQSKQTRYSATSKAQNSIQEVATKPYLISEAPENYLKTILSHIFALSILHQNCLEIWANLDPFHGTTFVGH